MINLYAYVRNNPLRYIDPTGEEFKGTDGRRVDIVEEDGQFVIKSKNATKELIKLVDLINRSGSETAASQFSRLNGHKTMINLVFDQDTDSSTTRGLHQPHGTRPDGTKGPLKFNDDDQFEGSVDITRDENGNEVYAEATITIYEGRFRRQYGSNTEAVEEGIVSTLGHEAEHDLDPLQVQTTKNRVYSDSIYHPQNPDGTHKAGSPYWIQGKIREEMREASILRGVKCIHGRCMAPRF